MVVATVVACYFGFLALLFFAQRAMLFPAPTAAAVHPPKGGQVVQINEGPNPVYALYVPAPMGAPTLVSFHGNGEQLSDEAYSALRFSELGVGFYAIEFPGYGPAKSQAPSEQAMYAAWESPFGTSPGRWRWTETPWCSWAARSAPGWRSSWRGEAGASAWRSCPRTRQSPRWPRNPFASCPPGSW